MFSIFLVLCGSFPKSGDPNMEPQSTIILIIGNPAKNVPLIFGKPPCKDFRDDLKFYRMPVYEPEPVNAGRHGPPKEYYNTYSGEPHKR